MKQILLLGSGELGKELAISLKRIGCNVIACDAYENAPAMQVSDKNEVFNMLMQKLNRNQFQRQKELVQKWQLNQL